MSRAGRAHGPTAKKREVLARVREAAAAHQAEKASGAQTVEVPEDVLRAHRANQLFIRCHAILRGRDRALWPGESIGAAIAETWMQNMLRALNEQAASGLVVPG